MIGFLHVVCRLCILTFLVSNVYDLGFPLHCLFQRLPPAQCHAMHLLLPGFLYMGEKFCRSDGLLVDWLVWLRVCLALSFFDISR